MNHPLVYIIVLNWNGMEHLQSCLSSLFRLNYENYRVVLVDNGSTDGSVPFVETTFPDVELIRNKRNVGFCRGNNRGMRLAIECGARYVTLLNNDTEVDPEWLTELVRVAENDGSIGALSSKMLMFYNRELINSTGVVCTPYGNAVDIGIGRYDAPKWNQAREVLAVCGGAFFVRSKVLKEVGLFPDYTIYLEDVDLSFRIWNAGYRIRYAPSAVVYHKFSATMGDTKEFKRKIYLNTRNRLWLICKHFPLSKTVFIARKLLPLEIRIICDGFTSGTYWKTTAEIRALLSTLLHLPLFAAYRLSALIHGRGRCRFWQLIDHTGSYYPNVRLPELRRTPDAKTRVIMGSEEGPLGQGWYPCDEENGRVFRWMGKHAKVLLDLPGGNTLLRLTMGNPFNTLHRTRLVVRVSGIVIGACDVTGGWEEYGFMFASKKGPALAELETTRLYDADLTGEPADYGVRVAEISVERSYSQAKKNTDTTQGEQVHENSSYHT